MTIDKHRESNISKVELKINRYIIENITEENLVVNVVAAREAPQDRFQLRGLRVRITAVADPEANLPQSAELKADYIAPGTEAYARFEAATRRLYNLDEDAVLNLAPYDVYFLADGARIEPEDGRVRVSMRFTAPVVADVAGEVEVLQSGVVHIRQDGTEEKLDGSLKLDADGAMTGADFTVDSFSIMGAVEEIGVAFEAANAVRADLASFIESVSINGVTLGEDGQYHLVPGARYTLALGFRENDENQFAESNLTLQLPDWLNSKNLSGTFDLEGVEDSAGIARIVANNRYSVDSNNVLTINWNTNDPNYNNFQDARNAYFDFAITGK